MLDVEWVRKERDKLSKQPLEMDTQGGARLDFLAFHLRNDKL